MKPLISWIVIYVAFLSFCPNPLAAQSIPKLTVAVVNEPAILGKAAPILIAKAVGKERAEAETLAKQLSDWKFAVERKRILPEKRGQYEEAIRQAAEKRRGLQERIERETTRQKTRLLDDIVAAATACAHARRISVVLIYWVDEQEQALHRRMSSPETLPAIIEASIDLTEDVLRKMGL